jgi:hypothetical protein
MKKLTLHKLLVAALLVVAFTASAHHLAVMTIEGWGLGVHETW